MFDEEERVVYETRMQSLADVEGKIASAEEKGIEKGREAASQSIALNMLKMKAEVDMIASVTGLSPEIIKKLQDNDK